MFLLVKHSLWDEATLHIAHATREEADREACLTRILEHTVEQISMKKVRRKRRPMSRKKIM